LTVHAYRWARRHLGLAAD